MHRDLLLQRCSRFSIDIACLFDLVVHSHIVVPDELRELLVFFLQAEDLVLDNKASFDVLIVEEHCAVDFSYLCLNSVIHLLASFFHVNLIRLDLILHLLE